MFQSAPFLVKNDPGNGLRINRRTMLKLLLAAGLSSPLSSAGTTSRQSMLSRAIPSTGEKLPVVGLGTSDEFESGAGTSLDQLREVLRLFVDSGGTLVDTAPGYGNAEEVLGNLIHDLGIAQNTFIATKVRTRGQQAGEDQFQRSEELLNKRPLDLIQVHSLVDVETQLGNQRRWKDAGRVRYIGITHSRVSAFGELERLMRKEQMDFRATQLLLY